MSIDQRRLHVFVTPQSLNSADVTAKGVPWKCSHLAFVVRNGNGNKDIDLPQDYNPLEVCLGFLLQMIYPGGEL